MKATGKRPENDRKAIQRLLGLLCTALLLAFAGGCRDAGSAATASQESDANMEVASETTSGMVARLSGDAEDPADEPEAAAADLENTGQETGEE